MSNSIDDYLKYIYKQTIQEKIDLVPTSKVACFFSYTNQSVIEMCKKLEERNLVKYIPYKGVYLTKDGEKRAAYIIRAHRIWEVFLKEKLNYTWDEVHIEAENLEHAISPTLLEKIYDFIGKPKFCQHGNPIPDENGNIILDDSIRLIDCIKNKEYIIKRIEDIKEILVFFDKNKIKIGSSLILIDDDLVKINGYEYKLDKEFLNNIWVN